MDFSTVWLPFPDNPKLDDNDISVVFLNLEKLFLNFPNLHRLLSADEQTRASRLRFERDRQRFVICRGLLRILLGRYLQRSPWRGNTEAKRERG